MIEKTQCPCCQLSKGPIVKSPFPATMNLESGQSKLKVLEVPK